MPALFSLTELQTAAAVQGKLRVGGFAADAQLIDQAVARPGSTQRVAGGNRLPAHNADRFQTVQIAFYAAAVAMTTVPPVRVSVPANTMLPA